MYSNILVPLAMDEGSEARIAAVVDVARHLAEPGARITLLHVMEQVPAYVDSYLPHDYIDALREALAKRISDLAATVPGACGVVVTGHSGRTILDYASEHGIDLVVMASHQPGMQDLLIGSTAGHVVRHARCSVHVLR
ncbi:universal stress protein [Sagittula salina]|uniref:Universal stress protein n=1 Tax=Sagittula salina TaxID=2820268 RepID=A0A940S355_9RHOB|nr:universal stress protein [Sagittula salina]MBP0482689.1 universal stress protein [Sagittula salina]